MTFTKATAELAEIDGFPGFVVSSGGAVFRNQSSRLFPVGKKMAQSPDRDGYMRVTLRQRGVPKCLPVHRLVAAAFIGKPTDCQTVNHKDFDLRNNSAANLEYLSRGDNSRHAAKAGRRSGERNANAKVTLVDVAEIRRLYALGATQAELGKTFGVSQVQISHIVRKTRGGWAGS